MMILNSHINREPLANSSDYFETPVSSAPSASYEGPGAPSTVATATSYNSGD